MQPTTRSRAVIYVRVSTKEQVEGNSLDVQERACREYCARENLDVAESFREEGESAKTANRTQFQKLLVNVASKRSGISVVVVYAVDRFMRDTTEHHAAKAILSRAGVSLRSATQPMDDSPSGQLTEGLLAVFAKFDNDVRAQRTRDGMRLAAERGQWMWQAPLGYRSGEAGGPSLLLDSERAPFVSQAFEAVASGEHKASALARLNALGFIDRKGRPIAKQTFDTMLRNPIYAGRITSKKMKVEAAGDFAPIVSAATYAEVQASVRRDRRGAGRVREHPEFPLRGFVRCTDCATPLTASGSQGNGGRYTYYACRNGCAGVRIRADRMHELFVALLASVQPKPTYLRMFREVVLDAWRTRRKSSAEARLQLAKQLDEIDAKRATATDKLVAGNIRQDAYELYQTKLDTQRHEVRTALAAASEQTDEIDDVLAFASRVLGDLSRLWLRLSPDAQRRFQRVVFPEGLRFDGQSFGTVTTGPVFTYLRAIMGGADGLVSPAGLRRYLQTMFQHSSCVACSWGELRSCTTAEGGASRRPLSHETYPAARLNPITSSTTRRSLGFGDPSWMNTSAASSWSRSKNPNSMSSSKQSCNVTALPAVNMSRLLIGRERPSLYSSTKKGPTAWSTPASA